VSWGFVGNGAPANSVSRFEKELSPSRRHPVVRRPPQIPRPHEATYKRWPACCIARRIVNQFGEFLDGSLGANCAAHACLARADLGGRALPRSGLVYPFGVGIVLLRGVGRILVLGFVDVKSGISNARAAFDIDFAKHAIRIRQSVDAATRSVQAVKSQASSADVPMPSQLEARLRALLRKHDGKSELLFVNRRGRPFSANKLREKQL